MPKTANRMSKERLAEEISRAVGAGRPVAVETVDFSNPERPLTCLEVDFPIIPVNQVAAIEGNAGKPIYQMSKWWARRRSSVFRALLLSAAMKAPEDPAEAAKAVWDVYYANHQKKGALKHLKVADIFMGGGTTIVEGSRLGMQMYGTDLNPVAWFIVKNELADVSIDEVQALLDDVEAEVKPQIMPFYACDCPRGHRGMWVHLPTGKVMGQDFDSLALTPNGRKDYRYEGPQVVYTFWVKHGPCRVTGCGHRTPVMSSPVMAVKTLTIKAWPDQACAACGKLFDLEEADARMAPGVPLIVAEDQKPYAILGPGGMATCPHCGNRGRVSLGKGEKKKVDLTLLVHPDWLKGGAAVAGDGMPLGGSLEDLLTETARWNAARAGALKVFEHRGTLSGELHLEDSERPFVISKAATLAANGIFTCGACGTSQRFVEALAKTGKTAPTAAAIVQGYCQTCDAEGKPYGGRFFVPAVETSRVDAAFGEWAVRSISDLKGFWPISEIPFGHMTHQRQPLPQHGISHWWKMFNSRQLTVHAQLLRAIDRAGGDRHRLEVREYVLGAFQQFLRGESSLSFWHMSHDHYAPGLSNSNFHPKSTTIEVGPFCPVGYGPWASVLEPVMRGLEWKASPWELVAGENLVRLNSPISGALNTKSEKVRCNDPVSGGVVEARSAHDVTSLEAESQDLVITDPPFSGLVHYAELADFFYVWLRLVLKDRYAEQFGPEYSPKALEVVANKAREPEDSEGFYKRLLTKCWSEAYRILKPGGILAFTFHHSEDDPWMSVLESLFEAGFYLEATYPIRSDESKGEGEFGSKKIEYDIIHVCRKRLRDPAPISWAKMRRQILQEVRQLQRLLEHHASEGLPAADLHVIKRGKALEYYSRHYGKVMVDQDQPMAGVREAIVGIKQMLDEESGRGAEVPPVDAQPLTREFLRIFQGGPSQARDQVQKFLRGSGVAPQEFEARGWCVEDKRAKTFTLVAPLDFAKSWRGRQRAKILHDYDQAMFLLGACVDGSGINASDTLRHADFRPHPALKNLLGWHRRPAMSLEVRQAALRALKLFEAWEASHKEKAQQLRLFAGE